MRNPVAEASGFFFGKKYLAKQNCTKKAVVNYYFGQRSAKISKKTHHQFIAVIKCFITTTNDTSF